VQLLDQAMKAGMSGAPGLVESKVLIALRPTEAQTNMHLERRRNLGAAA